MCLDEHAQPLLSAHTLCLLYKKNAEQTQSTEPVLHLVTTW
jgi:hypothetical protein